MRPATDRSARASGHSRPGGARRAACGLAAAGALALAALYAAQAEPAAWTHPPATASAPASARDPAAQAAAKARFARAWFDQRPPCLEALRAVVAAMPPAGIQATRISVNQECSVEVEGKAADEAGVKALLKALAGDRTCVQPRLRSLRREPGEAPGIAFSLGFRYSRASPATRRADTPWRSFVAAGLAGDREGAFRLTQPLEEWIRETGVSSLEWGLHGQTPAGPLSAILIDAYGRGTRESVARLLWRMHNAPFPFRPESLQIGTSVVYPGEVHFLVRFSVVYDPDLAPEFGAAPRPASRPTASGLFPAAPWGAFRVLAERDAFSLARPASRPQVPQTLPADPWARAWIESIAGEGPARTAQLSDRQAGHPLEIRAGQTVNGARIVAIEDGAVIYESRGITRRMFLRDFRPGGRYPETTGPTDPETPEEGSSRPAADPAPPAGLSDLERKMRDRRGRE